MSNKLENVEPIRKRVALFGYGYWGSRLARAIQANERLVLSHIIDPSVATLTPAQKLYPSAQCSQHIWNGLNGELDLVVVATKASQHFEIAKWALENSIPTIVTKPLTLDPAQDRLLDALSARTNTPLFVDFTYLFSSGIQTMKQAIADGLIGAPTRLISLRTNLGIIQSDCDVLWDLAVHDLSIIDYLFEPHAATVSVVGVADPLSPQLSTATVNIFAYGDTTTFSTVGVSWFSARKSRLIVVDGSRGTLQFDDTQISDKLQLTKGQVDLSESSESEITRRITSYTIGQTENLTLDNIETLQREFDQILDAISGLHLSLTNPAIRTAQIARRVGILVRACQTSLESDGKSITVVLE